MPSRWELLDLPRPADRVGARYWLACQLLAALRPSGRFSVQEARAELLACDLAMACIGADMGTELREVLDWVDEWNVCGKPSFQVGELDAKRDGLLNEHRALILPPLPNGHLRCPDEVIECVHRVAGREVSPSTVRFWISRGLQPRDGGPRIRLRTLRFGTTTVTTEAAILEFAEAAARTEDEPEAKVKELKKRRRRNRNPNRAAEAIAFLEAEGL